MTPHEFGCKCANWFSDYNDQFENTYGVDLRLPHDYHSLRQMLVSAGIGGGLGLARGVFWPGYHEKLDEHGNVVAKKRRAPWLGALEGAAIGAGTSALSNYASQVATQYNPEIDRLLHGVKDHVNDMLPVTSKTITGVDVGKQLFDRISGTV